MINQRLFYITLVTCLGLSSQVHALESLTDAQLSNKTAQDGITATINLDGSATQEAGTIGLEAVRLVDKDGFATTNLNTTGAGAASFNFAPGGIRLCQGSTASATCATVTEAVRLDIDADGNGGAPVVSINIQTQAGSYFIPVRSVSLLGLQTETVGVLSKDSINRNIATSEVTMLEFGNQGIAVNLAQALSARIELGNQAQGALVVIDPNVVSLDFGRMDFLSYDEGVAGSNTAESSFGFDLSLTGVDFADGIKVDIDSQAGLEANLGDVNIAQASLSNISFGDTSPTSTTNISSVDGLRNASIGSFSLSNASFNDVRVGITGL